MFKTSLLKQNVKIVNINRDIPRETLLILYCFGEYTSYPLVEIFLIFIFLKITVGITILLCPWKWKEAIHGLIHMLNNIGTA